jgi:hypothetical protein
MGFTPYCFADDSATRNFARRRFFKAGRRMVQQKTGRIRPAG